MTRVRIAVVLLAVSLLAAFAVHARIGGGDSYSGSSDSSSSHSSSGSDRSHDSGSYGSSSDDSRSRPDNSPSSSSPSSGRGAPMQDEGCVIVFVVFLMGLVILGALIVISTRNPGPVVHVTSSSPAGTRDVLGSMAELRRVDPNFSEIVFTDFCYSLYARFYDALGRGRLDDLAPYVSLAVRNGVKYHATTGLSRVSEIVIGGFTVTSFSGIHHLDVEAKVDFEANYTETSTSGTRRLYVRERWTLERACNILSPAPEHARAEHCPRCGAPLQTRTDGACLHCGTVITNGQFQWFVRSIQIFEKDERPRALGGSAPEVGTNLPTVYPPSLGWRRQTFVSKHPGFTWEAFLERVRHVNQELQAAWTSCDWQRARPYETDALFQMHRYWIDEYLRQGVRNVVDDFAIGEVEIVKIRSDAFYDAITVRIFASGKDYTINERGAVIGGSPSATRTWSEYWTFVRGRAGAAADARICPNCGGPLAEGQTAICSYCGGKITTGEFPWVLSRIEQDEAYRG